MTELEMTQLRCVFVPFDWYGKVEPQAIELAPGERIVGVREVGGQGPPTLRVWLASATTTGPAGVPE